MKTIKDLTIDQAVEIAQLLYPYPNQILSEMKAEYYKTEFDVKKGIFDDEEYYEISFDAKALSKPEHFICHIYPSLDCYIATYEFIKYPEPRTDGYYKHKTDYPNRNQYKIQNKFREWEIAPEEDVKN